MNTSNHLTPSPLARTPRMAHSDTPQAGMRNAHLLATRGPDFRTQPPDDAHLLRTASSPRLVSHWVILEGCSRRMFWTLST